MSPIEIVLSIILLLLLPVVGFRLGKQFAKKLSFNVDKRKKVLQDIQDALQSGIDTLNSMNLSPQELKKLKIKKDKFLSKAFELITEISSSSGVKQVRSQLPDKLLGDTIEVDILPEEDIKKTGSYSDYLFAYSIIKELIEDTKFPKKEDYLQLNSLYKKYKSLNK